MGIYKVIKKRIIALSTNKEGKKVTIKNLVLWLLKMNGILLALILMVEGLKLWLQ